MRNDLTPRQRAMLRALGQDIDRRRQALGLSKAEVARRAGVHVNLVSRLVHDQTNVSILVLDAVAGALETDLAELFTSALKKRR